MANLLEMLLKKSGSQSPTKRFRQMVKHIARHDHLPDYRVTFDEETDKVTFYNRESWWDNRPLPSDGETLSALPTQAYEDGRRLRPAMTFTVLKRNGGTGGLVQASPNSVIRRRPSWVSAGAVTSATYSAGRHWNRNETPVRL